MKKALLIVLYESVFSRYRLREYRHGAKCK